MATPLGGLPPRDELKGVPRRAARAHRWLMLGKDVGTARRLLHRGPAGRRRLPLPLLLALLLAATTVLPLVSSGVLARDPQRSRIAGVRASPARARARAHRPIRPHAGRVQRLSLPATLPARTIHVPILMYHRIDEPRPTLPAITRALTVAPADFAAQMRWLAAHRFHTLTQAKLFHALEQGAPLPRKAIVITFDDGYRDVLVNAAPVLRRLRMHATAYVITGRTSGRDVSFLSWAQLHTLERDGIEIGSHTVHHAELPALSDAAALRELRQSRRALEGHLHHPVQWFSYPAGRLDARTEALVRRAGYVLAVTTRPGAAQSARSPLALHRYEVLDTTGVRGLAALLGG